MQASLCGSLSQRPLRNVQSSLEIWRLGMCSAAIGDSLIKINAQKPDYSKHNCIR